MYDPAEVIAHLQKTAQESGDCCIKKAAVLIARHQEERAAILRHVSDMRDKFEASEELYRTKKMHEISRDYQLKKECVQELLSYLRATLS